MDYVITDNTCKHLHAFQRLFNSNTGIRYDEDTNTNNVNILNTTSVRLQEVHFLQENIIMNKKLST